MSQIRVAIVGATGYTGAELVRLLAFHPQVTIVAVTSGRAAGERLEDHCPWLRTDLVLSAFDPATIEADVVFLAQEHGFAMKHAPTLIARGIKVIDLSADYRLNDPVEFEKYYKMPFVKGGDFRVTYGLPELGRVTKADLVANPGCYPTATLLGLVPLYRAGIVKDSPVIDAKSGVSGAGRAKNSTDMIFNERNQSFAAYGVTGHRHVPELEKALGVKVRFTPHLIPVARGMEVTSHVSLARSVSQSELDELFRDFYAGRAFVRYSERIPETKAVVGSNRCDISARIDEHTGSVVVLSAIDNLVKGASGQAIQNMNIQFDLPEQTGLPVHGVWP